MLPVAGSSGLDTPQNTCILKQVAPDGCMGHKDGPAIVVLFAADVEAQLAGQVVQGVPWAR